MTGELRDFHHFLEEMLKGGQADVSPEEALDQWRRLHPDFQAAEEDAQAIEEALADMAQGDQGMPFDDFDRDFRRRHNLPNKS
jgi:hypothetical protein